MDPDPLSQLEEEANKEQYIKSANMKEKMLSHSDLGDDDELNIDPVKSKPQEPEPESASKTKSKAKGPKTFTVSAEPQVEQKPKELSQDEVIRRKVVRLNWISVALGVVSCIVIATCLLLAYGSFERKFFPFQGIRESWSNELILDIQTSIGNACPSGTKPAAGYDWPGAFEGCDCRKITKPGPKTVTRGKCSASMKSNGCVDSPSVEQIKLVKWRDPDVLCVRRLAGVTFENSLLNSQSDGQCKEGFKRCIPIDKLPQIGGSPDYSRSLCIASNLECPISDVRVSPCQVNPDATCFQDTVAGKIELGNNECLWKTKVCGPGPISRLAFSEESLCRLERETQIAKNHVEHPLIRAPRSQCDVSENGFAIDRMAMSNFLLLTSPLPHTISYYKEETDANFFSLFKVYYTRWKSDHRTALDVDLVFNNQSFIERLEKYHWNAFTFVVIGLIVLGGLTPGLLVLEGRFPHLYTGNAVLLSLKYLLIWFFKIAPIPILMLLRKFNMDLFGKFNLFSNASFSNIYENGKIKEVAHSLEKGIFLYDTIAFYTSLVLVLVDIILIVMICASEKTRIKREELDMNESLGQLMEMETKVTLPKKKFK